MDYEEIDFEEEEMNEKAFLIGLLASIKGVAKEYGEIHTVQHIEKIMKEIRE